MSAGNYGGLLKSVGFQAFLWTLFLGILNDNVLKIVLSLYAKEHIALIGAVFILPYILFSGYAGYLADRFNKRSVLIATKSMEILSMGLAIVAFYLQNFPMMMAVLFLMALQSTLFSPAKFGIIPEMLPERELSRGNGLVEMATFLSIILGSVLAGAMFTAWADRTWWIGAWLIVIAAAGFAASFGIPRVPGPASKPAFLFNPWGEIAGGLAELRTRRALWLTVLGITYFWFLGALFQMVLILLGGETMGLNDLHTGLLFTYLAVGIGAGSLAAGKLSGDIIELGLVPLGSLGMGFFCLALYFSTGAYWIAMVQLVLLGFFAGVFSVPLHAFLQQQCGEDGKGRIMATGNFVNTIGILLASGVLWAAHGALGVPPERIILFMGLFTLACTAYAVYLLPVPFMRMVLWLGANLVYRVRVNGRENVPAQGPALLVCNHVSYVDGLLVGICLQRLARFVIHRPFYENKYLKWFCRSMKMIPVSDAGRRDMVEAIKAARAELGNGHLVCIFAEGGLTRTGNMLPFKRGFEKIAEGMEIPVIPVHLDQLWGSIFSYRGGKVFWKRPEKWPYPVTVSFGAPRTSPVAARDLRQDLMVLGAEALKNRRGVQDLLHARFIKAAKRNWGRFCMADSTGRELTFGRALAAAMLLVRKIRARCPNQSRIGILLPPSAGGALANIASQMAGKVPVNLNYSAGEAMARHAIERCGIETVITSKRFLEKIRFAETGGMVFIEDWMASFGRFQKTAAYLAARLLPAWRLRRMYREPSQTPDGLAAILFSSGSSGDPKGVMLSHAAVLANIEGFHQLFGLGPRDKVMGVLPFFHAFGHTVTLWFPLAKGFGAVYHPNPMDAAGIGAMVSKHRATILLSTPTFYANYIKKCKPEHFAPLRYAVAGAERLRESVADAFREKFGLPLLEGYGCTELGPAVSVNVPDAELESVRQIGHKPGTVGQPIPGVAVKVVDPETGASLPAGAEGLLMVHSPARMTGYWQRPDLTGEAVRDGWYATGDIASIDRDGFIAIVDRMSRFGKIGGEMVPLGRIEELAAAAEGVDQCAAASLPGGSRGERVVLLYTGGAGPETVWKHLSGNGLPPLWVPKRGDIRRVESLPVLGTGKMDIRGINRMAFELAGAEPA